MKVGLCVIGAIIQDENMLYKSIESVESLTDWNEKVILMDGLPETASSTQSDNYSQMLEDVKSNKSKFEVKSFDKNIYFKKMLRWLLDNYECDYWFICQDDVVIQELDVWAELGVMNALNANIMSYPHKPIVKSTHWFEIIEDVGDYVKTHGWSERCFILKSEPFKELIKKDVRGENNFCDTIYHRFKNTTNFSSENQKLEYWDRWRCFLNNNVTHKHLVGKRR
tara:strand:- start:508 stop:1179 length:672 start_codon:yes stop_codon:yes gene_type:complete